MRERRKNEGEKGGKSYTCRPIMSQDVERLQLHTQDHAQNEKTIVQYVFSQVPPSMRT